MKTLVEVDEVSAVQICARSSSRVTSSPGRFSKAARTCKGWPWRRSLTPRLRSSPARTSSSKLSKRSTRGPGARVGIATPVEVGQVLQE